MWEKELPNEEPALSLATKNYFPFVLFFWAAVCMVALGATTLGHSQDRTMLACLATVTATIPLLGLQRGGGKWFHPLLFVTVPAFIGLGLRSWYLLFRTESSGAQKLLRGADPMQIVMTGTLALAVGLVALVLGYSVKSHFPSSQAQRSKSGDWIASWAWTNVILIVAILIGLLGTWFYIRAVGAIDFETLSTKRYVELENGLESSGAFYSRAAAIPAFTALPVVAYRARGQSIPLATSFLLGACVLSSLIAPFVSSSRTDIIATLVVFGIVWSSTKRILSWRLIGLSALAGLALMVLLVMGSLRCQHQNGSVQACSVASQVEQSLLANENWMSVSKTARIVEEVPTSVGYQYGKTLVSAVFAPIPRVLWAEKPDVRTANLVGFEILKLPEGQKTGATAGFVGELYINFGWPAVITGMFLLGWGLRMCWNGFSSDPSDFGISAYAILITQFALRLPENDFTGVLLPAMQGIVILGILRFVNPLSIRSFPTGSALDSSDMLKRSI